MGTVVLGGLSLQWPIGRLADRYDRRLVLAGVLVAAGVSWPLLASLSASGLPLFGLLALALLFGGAVGEAIRMRGAVELSQAASGDGGRDRGQGTKQRSAGHGRCVADGRPPGRVPGGTVSRRPRRGRRRGQVAIWNTTGGGDAAGVRLTAGDDSFGADRCASVPRDHMRWYFGREDIPACLARRRKPGDSFHIEAVLVELGLAHLRADALSGARYDRGHMAPQRDHLNRVTWERLEAQVLFWT